MDSFEQVIYMAHGPGVPAILKQNAKVNLPCIRKGDWLRVELNVTSGCDSAIAEQSADALREFETGKFTELDRSPDGKKKPNHEGLAYIGYEGIVQLAEYLKVYTWSMILERGLVSRRKFFRLKKFFKDLGFENPASMILPVPDEKRGAFLEYHDAVEKIITAHNVQRFVRPF